MRAVRTSSTNTRTRPAKPVMSAKKLTDTVAHKSGLIRKPPARTATLWIWDSMIHIVPSRFPEINRASPHYNPENPENVSGRPMSAHTGGQERTPEIAHIAGYDSGLNGPRRCRCPDLRFSPKASATLSLPLESVAPLCSDDHETTLFHTSVAIAAV